MLQKVHRLTAFKALKDADGNATGSFEAIVSVFGNVDLVGDRVMPGAFADTIKAWQDSGDPVPVIWSHQWDNPQAHIGFVDPGDLEETSEGLKVVGKLDIETNPFAKQVYDLLAARRVREFSFAYDVQDEAPGEDGANELKKLDLIEVGPTLKGANPATQLLGVKDVQEMFGAKAGRVLSSKNEAKLREAAAAIAEVLASLPEPTDDGKRTAPRTKHDELDYECDECGERFHQQEDLDKHVAEEHPEKDSTADDTAVSDEPKTEESAEEDEDLKRRAALFVELTRLSL